jgi:SAM-dependent methyltransferase
VDIPRSFTIRESSHRIHNPFTDEKLATLGRVLALASGWRILDLASGSGEMLCTWARDHHISGTGVDLCAVFTANARKRAVDLGVADQVNFVHADASNWVSPQPVDVAACIGATWIGNGVAGTVELLQRSLRPGGLLLIGEPYWLQEPPDNATVEGCGVRSRDEFVLLPDLVQQFSAADYDVVEMVLADQEGWDRYQAAQWLNTRRWLDLNPNDDLAAELRAELHEAAGRYTRYQREYLGWGVFALLAR